MLCLLIKVEITSAQTGTDYYPFHVGDYWVEHTDMFGGEYKPTTSRIEIESLDLINGKEYFRQKQSMTIDDGSDEMIWYSWMRVDSTSIIMGAFGESPDIVQIDIPIKTIIVDGNPDDWNGISALVTDTQGDDSPSYIGDDIKSLFIAKDTDYLYLRMDLWDSVNTNFGNGPSPNEGIYQISVYNDGPYDRMQLGIGYDLTISQWSLGYNGSSSDVPQGLEGPGYVGVSGGIIEIKLPFALIGTPSNYQGVEGEVNNCCVQDYGILDEAGLVSASIFDPPLLWMNFPETMYVGYTWESNVPAMGGNYIWIVESLSETVQVTAGTFNDCIKMKLIIVDTAGDTVQISNMYYAQGVGTVMNKGWGTWSYEFQFELIEYYIQSSNVYAPVIAISETTIYFGAINIGNNSTFSITMINNGNAELIIYSTELSGSNYNEFTITNASGTQLIAPSDSSQIILSFSPQSEGSKSAMLIVTSNAESSPDTLTLRGTGVAPIFTVSAESINYDTVLVGENKNDTLTISNTGSSSLTISQTIISGSQAGDFSIVSGTGSKELAPSHSYEMIIKFFPQNEGNRSAYLVISSNASSSPDSITLNGLGMVLSVQVESEPAPIAGENLTVTATPSENFKPTTYLLYYRNAGETEWQSIGSETSGDSLNFTIPSDSISYRGIEYYIQLSDGQNVVTYPPDNPQTNPARIQVTVDRQEAPIDLKPMKYKMISVPILLDTTNIWSVLGDDYDDYNIKHWRLLRWQTWEDSTGYFEYISQDSLHTYEIDSSFTPGNAFWLITRNGEKFRVTNGLSIKSSEPFYYTLQPGWNQVANPFAFPVAVEMISNRDSLESPVYYDGTEYKYEQTILYPWEGYFVFNTSTEPVTISIPPIEASSRGLPKTKNRFETVSEDGYLLQLSAKMPDTKLVDTQNYVGFSPRALDIKDKFDLSEAPPIGDYLQVSIIEGEDRFASNFKSISEPGQQWDLEIGISEFIKKPIEFTLIESGKLPDNFKLFVLDKDYFSSIPIENNKFMLEINKEFPTRKLKLIIGTKEFAQQHNEDIPLQPIEYQLKQNFPNPFNAETTIQYQLGKRTPVVLSIYDILGRKVRTVINERQTTGYHSIRWDGLNKSKTQVASGLYFYRIEAGDFLDTKKLLLVR